MCPVFEKSNNTVWEIFDAPEAFRPQHITRKCILDQKATWDTRGYIPHPQDLALSPSLTYDSEKKGGLLSSKLSLYEKKQNLAMNILCVSTCYWTRVLGLLVERIHEQAQKSS